jgi:hypothetical protein
MGFRLGIAFQARGPSGESLCGSVQPVLPSRLLQISAGLIVTIIAAARLCKTSHERLDRGSISPLS